VLTHINDWHLLLEVQDLHLGVQHFVLLMPVVPLLESADMTKDQQAGVEHSRHWRKGAGMRFGVFDVIYCMRQGQTFESDIPLAADGFAR
jgi:hypothetical protein